MARLGVCCLVFFCLIRKVLLFFLVIVHDFVTLLVFRMKLLVFSWILLDSPRSQRTHPSLFRWVMGGRVFLSKFARLDLSR